MSVLVHAEPEAEPLITDRRGFPFQYCYVVCRNDRLFLETEYNPPASWARRVDSRERERERETVCDCVAARTGVNCPAIGPRDRAIDHGSTRQRLWPPARIQTSEQRAPLLPNYIQVPGKTAIGEYRSEKTEGMLLCEVHDERCWS